MMPETTPITLEATVNAPAETLYTALTTPTGLQSWLCNRASFNATADSPFFLAWNDNNYAAGQVVELVQNEKVVLSWRGNGDTVAGTVTFALAVGDGGTIVSVTHEGIADDTTRDIVAGHWTESLETLKLNYETGEDRRAMQTPMLGFFPSGSVNEDNQAQYGTPEIGGTIIGGVVPGTGAESIGLQALDVIVSVAGTTINGPSVLGQAVADKKAGDEVEVVFYREGERMVATMPLSPRRMPPTPDTLDGVLGALKTTMADLDRELDATLDGVTETEADFKPGDGEWNVKEVLAHLIWTERYIQMQIWGAASGNDNVPYGANDPQPAQAILAANPSLPDLVAEMKRAQDGTVALIEGLPEPFSQNRVLFKRYSVTALYMASHNRGHFRQMTETVEAARAAITV